MYYVLNSMLMISGVMLIAQGCSTPKAKSGATHTFDQYIETFRHEASKRGINIEPQAMPTMYEYPDLPSPNKNILLGYCRQGGGEHPSIHMNMKQWHKMTDGCKERHVFHELGHCVLNKKHKEIGFTIMTEIQPWDCSVYELNREASLDDLFERN